MTVVKEWFQLLQSAKKTTNPKKIQYTYVCLEYTLEPYRTASQKETA